VRPPTLVTPPSGEVLSLDEAKHQCQLELTDDAHDAFLIGAIAAAVDAAEDRTGLQFLPATWMRTLDRWPCERWIELPRPPLISVTSITYVDLAGVTQTFAASNYVVDAPAGRTVRRGRVGLKSGVVYPSAQAELNAIRVTYLAGYANADQVPARLKQGMKMLIGHWFANRETVMVGTIHGEIEHGFDAAVRDYVSHATQRDD
jgi:uncharacterized phiE125 gp8 family phage protein